MVRALVRMSEVSFRGKAKSSQVEGAASATVKGPQRNHEAQSGEFGY